MKQQRYSNRERIINAIDRNHRNMTNRSIEADRLEDWNKQAYVEMQKLKPGTSEHSTIFSAAQRNKLECTKLRRRNNSTLERLERLKHTLAAFDTVAMPFTEDKSVVLQP